MTTHDIDHDIDPVTSIDRLLDISGIDLESPVLRTALDHFAHQAAERLHMPAGMITIVLDGAQYVAGSHGIDGTWIAEAEGTPVEWSFCVNTVRTGTPYVVTDAATDPLQHDNPVVVHDGIRSYAGAPLISPDGHVIGACCVAGFETHEFSPDDLETLRGLSAEVITQMERHRFDDAAA